MTMQHTLLSVLALSAAAAAQALPAVGGPSLEIGVTANGASGVDLRAEKQRLLVWLQTAGNATRLRADPQRVAEYNRLSPAQGGADARLQWLPHAVQRGGPVFSRAAGGVTAVPLFSEAELKTGAEAPLWELIAIDRRAPRWTAADLTGVRVEASTDGEGAVLACAPVPARRAEFDRMTREREGAHLAWIVDGEVRAAARLPAAGATDVVSGARPRPVLDELVAAMRSAAVPAAKAVGETVVSAPVVDEVPASADPEDIAAMQSAQAMLAAERRLRELIKAGKLDGIDRILTFEELESWPYEDGLLGMPPSVKKLHGSHVMMTGFMLPIDEVENIKEFLLVQSLWSCCYGQPPDINGLVRIVMQGDARIDYQFEPIKVVGKFVVEAAMEDGYCVDIYQLHAESVEVIE